MKGPFELIDSQKSFGGRHQRYRHFSRTLNCEMIFAIYLPPRAEPEVALSALYWLSGLTCTDGNFMRKAGTQRIVAELGLILAAPDTGPHGSDVPGNPDGAWDFGLGTGFYLNATQELWTARYHMHGYVVHELLVLVETYFPVSRWCGISGRSIGGHGVLVCALCNPGRYLSLSALAPICHLSDCPWDQEASLRYPGEDPTAWHGWDACASFEGTPEHLPTLADQDERNDLLAVQLKLEALHNAADKTGHPLELRLRPGCDHNYHFIVSFAEDHLHHHTQALNG